VRLQRYVIQEIGEITRLRFLARSATLGATLAVLFSVGLALFPVGGGGDAGFAFGRLWQLFGTTNQLTAGLALAVIAVWLFLRGRNPLAAIVPLVFLLTMTVWSLILNLINFLTEPDYLLLSIDVIILILALWLIVEAAAAMNRVRISRRDGTDTQDTQETQG
jgi:carbon starvation protein